MSGKDKKKKSLVAVKPFMRKAKPEISLRSLPEVSCLSSFAFFLFLIYDLFIQKRKRIFDRGVVGKRIEAFL